MSMTKLKPQPSADVILETPRVTGPAVADQPAGDSDDSPALALQQSLKAALESPGGLSTHRPRHVEAGRPWSARRKLVFIVGASGLLWAGIILSARALFG